MLTVCQNINGYNCGERHQKWHTLQKYDDGCWFDGGITCNGFMLFFISKCNIHWSVFVILMYRTVKDMTTKPIHNVHRNAIFSGQFRNKPKKKTNWKMWAVGKMLCAFWWLKKEDKKSLFLRITKTLHYNNPLLEISEFIVLCLFCFSKGCLASLIFSLCAVWFSFKWNSWCCLWKKGSFWKPPPLIFVYLSPFALQEILFLSKVFFSTLL